MRPERLVTGTWQWTKHFDEAFSAKLGGPKLSCCTPTTLSNFETSSLHSALKKKFHLAIRLAAIALTIAALCILIFWPTSETSDQRSGRLTAEIMPSESISVTGTEPPERLEGEMTDGVWYERSLRATSTTPATQATEDGTKMPPKKASEFRLLGTIIEPGHSFAMIEDRSGVIDAQPVGGLLRLDPPGYRIEQIEPYKVTLSRLDSTVLLRLSDAKRIRESAETGSVDQMNLELSGSDEPASAFSGAPPRGGFDSLISELDWLSGNDPQNNTGTESSNSPSSNSPQTSCE
jgi:hypothetical protein